MKVLLWLILAVAAGWSRAAVLDSRLVALGKTECAQVLGCTCSSNRHLNCSRISHAVLDQIAVFYPQLATLTINKFTDETLDLGRFANLTRMTKLSVADSYVTAVMTSSGRGPVNLRELKLQRNALSNWTLAVCSWVEAGTLPKLERLDLSGNQLEAITDCTKTPTFEILDVSSNEIAKVEADFGRWRVKQMNLSMNALKALDSASSMWMYADLSWNPLETLTLPVLPDLNTLNISHTNLFAFPVLLSPKLRLLEAVDLPRLTTIDLLPNTMPSLEIFEIRDLPKLIQVTGVVPPRVKAFALTGTPKLNTLPTNFFESARALSRVQLSENTWSCLKCAPLWERPLREKFGNLSGCTAVTVKEFPPEKPETCKLGIKAANTEIVKGRYGTSVTVPCAWFGTPPPKVEWWLYRPATLIGTYDPTTHKAQTLWTRNGSYELLPGGALVVHGLTRDLVERYTCIVVSAEGKANSTIRVRLDYSAWYGVEFSDSVFWGSILCSLFICCGTFALNILWIISRKSILWWIHRTERISRVRKMVEAVEKYRVRQIDNLHDAYSKRMNTIRENYHQQVEALRSSYAWQAERFRDYRTQQMENVSAHLETIRENYNQQMARLREYGSRRADQLWESYDRQVNRVRTFSLQHRMKLARQYKVKQRYLNKLLESFNEQWNPDAVTRHEAAVRAALDLHEVAMDDVTEDEEEAKRNEHSEPGLSLSRASSFYSLPEFVLDDDGKLHSPPMTAVMKRNLRFDEGRRKRVSNSISISSPKSEKGGEFPMDPSDQPGTSQSSS